MIALESNASMCYQYSVSDLYDISLQPKQLIEKCIFLSFTAVFNME